MVFGLMEILKAKAFYKYLIIAVIMVILRMIRNQAMDFNSLEMVMYIKDSIMVTNLKEQVDINGKKEVIIKDNLGLDCVGAKVSGCLRKETYIMVILSFT